MILSDRSILEEVGNGKLVIDPLTLNNVQPASVDLTLGNEFVFFPPDTRGTLQELVDHVVAGGVETPLPRFIDLGDRTAWPPPTREVSDEGFWLEPQGFVLGSTAERVKLPPNMVGRVEGKSSLGRVGLAIHSTAGFIDPGFEGNITLEFTNDNSLPIILRPGVHICQLAFQYTSTPVERPYGHPDLNSKYQGQNGTTQSRYEG